MKSCHLACRWPPPPLGRRRRQLIHRLAELGRFGSSRWSSILFSNLLPALLPFLSASFPPLLLPRCPLQPWLLLLLLLWNFLASNICGDWPPARVDDLSRFSSRPPRGAPEARNGHRWAGAIRCVHSPRAGLRLDGVAGAGCNWLSEGATGAPRAGAPTTTTEKSNYFAALSI